MISPKHHPSLGSLLAEAHQTHLDVLACIEADRDRENLRWTHSRFRSEVHRVAGWLHDQGVAPGDRVAIVLPNQAAWLVAADAILRVGAVVVPLERRLTPSELATLLTHAAPKVAFLDGPLVSDLPDAAPTVVAIGPGAPEGSLPWEELEGTDPGLAPRTRSDAATLVYSSGTGGDPKGCLLPHGAYLSQYGALMSLYRWDRGDRYFSILPTNHAIDFLCGFIASFATGTTVIHQRTLRPELLVSTMRRYRVNHMAVVPMVLKGMRRAIEAKLNTLSPVARKALSAAQAAHRGLAARQPRPQLARWLFKPIHDAFGGELRQLFCGGAFTPEDDATFFFNLGIPVAIGYGLTEACTVVTVQDLKPFRADSVGRAVPGVDLRIHDPGPDGVGEVQVRGPTVFQGYLNNPDATEAAFDGDWLRTGDLGFLDASMHLHLVGRRKNMIVTAGGKNVYPEDIEAGFHHVPAESLCAMAEDYLFPRRGLTDERLLLVVHPGTGPDAPSQESLLATLREANRRQPEHKRVAGVLWWPEPFPRTASLKVKRHQLAEDLRARTTRDDVAPL